MSQLKKLTLTYLKAKAAVESTREKMETAKSELVQAVREASGGYNPGYNSYGFFVMGKEIIQVTADNELIRVERVQNEGVFAAYPITDNLPYCE